MRAVVSSVAYSAALTLFCAFPASVLAETPFQLQRFEGTVNVSSNGVVPFTLKGEAPELGKFNSFGEMQFVHGEIPGSLVGQGVMVLKNAAGEVLVGVTKWEVSRVVGEQRLASMQFSWRDTVRLSNGTAVSSTGRFVHQRPGDMTANGIIAILIGLLVPAPQ